MSAMSEPQLFSREYPCAWRRIVQASAMVALAASLVIALAPGTTTLVVFGLLTLWCHGPLSPLLPAAYEPVLLGYGRLYSPFMLALFGALASTGIEYVNYHLYRKLLRVESLDRALRGPQMLRLMAPFYRRPFLTVWLCVLTPLPDWATRVLASHSGYSVRRYLTAVFLARVPRFWLLAVLGVQLELGAWVIVAMVTVSAAVTLLGWARRQSVPASTKAAAHTGVLLLGLITALIPRGSLSAQDATPRLAGSARGMSMDRFMTEGSGLMAMTYRFSTLRPGSLGAELGVSLFPQALPAGVLALAPDIGASYNITVSGGSVLLKTGGSAVLALGLAGAYFIPGFHLGGALLIQAGDRSAVRIDVVKHYYLPSGGKVQPVWSVGLGFAILPRIPI